MLDNDSLDPELLKQDGTLKDHLLIEPATIQSIRNAWSKISDMKHSGTGDELKELREYVSSALFRSGLVAHALRRKAAESVSAKEVVADLGDELNGVWIVLQQLLSFLVDRFAEQYKQQ